MSFLSRKPARPGNRNSDAGRDDEYDDYDLYAADGYQSEDDGWSPGEYFSPEGIKGKWAGQRPDGRAGGRGHRDDGRGDPGADYDSYSGGFDGAAYGGAGRGQGGERSRGADAPRGTGFPPVGDSPQDAYAGYGADEYSSGAYDLPNGADEVRPERSRRWRRDREDRTDWTGILRLRRDKGEDIWPDDGISDEDYWASVSADQPLNGAEVPDPDDRRAPGAARRPGAGPRAGAASTDSPFGDQRGEKPRGVTGRLGPPPGLADDYQPGGTSAGGGLPGGPGQPSGNGGPGFGWMSAGSAPARSGTGSTPTVGVTSSRPPASQNGMRPASAGASSSGPNDWSPAARPGTGSGGFPEQPPARPSFQPSFQPNGYQPGSGPAGGRQQDRGDWGERTERIDRVNASGSPVGGRPQDRGDWGERTERIDRVDASGYPDPRAASRSQGPGLPGSSSQPMGFGPSFTGSGTSAPAGGRADGDPRQAPDRRAAGRRDAEGRDAGRREADRDGSRATGSIWSIPARAAAPGAGDDDPLTSSAYSRSALAENDGRSYRTAARLSQAQAKLTDQTDPFASGPYPQGQYNGRTGDYPAASYQQAEQRSGEYRQHRSDAPAAPAPAPGGRYPSYGSQPGQGQAGPSQGQRPGQGPAPGQPGQPGRGAASTGRPGAVSGPGPSVPGGGLPGRQYESQHSRPSQPQRQQGQPPATPLAAPVYSGNSAPSAGSAPSGDPAGPPGGGGPADGRQAGTGGLNPYDGTTGSYPYAAQPYPSRPAAPTGPVPAGSGLDGDGRYRRPVSQDGYARGTTDQNRGGQSRAEQSQAGQNGDDPNRNGYGAGYGSNRSTSRERPY
jgi:hypothetical protein